MNVESGDLVFVNVDLNFVQNNEMPSISYGNGKR